jgi:hypothetical protein
MVGASIEAREEFIHGTGEMGNADNQPAPDSEVDDERLSDGDESEEVAAGEEAEAEPTKRARSGSYWLPRGRLIRLILGEPNEGTKCGQRTQMIGEARCEECGDCFTNHRHGRDHMVKVHGAGKKPAAPAERQWTLFDSFGIQRPAGDLPRAGTARLPDLPTAPLLFRGRKSNRGIHAVRFRCSDSSTCFSGSRAVRLCGRCRVRGFAPFRNSSSLRIVGPNASHWTRRLSVPTR